MVEAVQYEDYTPSWVNTHRHVQLSEYTDWEAVGEWAQRINPVPGVIDSTLAAMADDLLRQSGHNPKRFADAAIRFVQDEVRYTGVEIGEYSHRAHQPLEVFTQRYGDCKDKSLLLVSMLRHGGIDAHLALVNTTLGSKINEQLPAPSVFNHAIVQFIIDEKTYWTDPTISHQGGDLDNRSMPIYGPALVLKSAVNTLEYVTSNQSGIVICEERYLLSADEEAMATFTVETTYSGHEADQLRSQLAYGSVWDTEKNYLDYYSKLYPEISSTDSLHIQDNRELNRITVVEHYRVPNFLTKNETGHYQVDLFAQPIYDRLPKIPGTKTQPIAVNYPGDVEYRIAVVSPYGWNMRRTDFFLDRGGYVFGASSFAKADTLFIEYQFKYHTPEIPIEKRAEFASDVKTIVDQQLSNTITINLAAQASGSHIAWYAFLWAMALIGLSAYLGRMAYRKPFIKVVAETDPLYDQIGGWLILPLLAFLLTPFVVSIFLINTGYFNTAIWNVFQGTTSNIPYKLLLAFEFTGNVIVITLSVVCAIFMVQRKAMLPLFAVGFYLFNFVFVLFDFLLLYAIPNLAAPASNEVFTVIRAFVSAAVWVPYFMLSSRVRQTFIAP